MPAGFQQWFNRHRTRFSTTFNTNLAEPAASTAIISGWHHAAIAATATKLEGRVTIHTYMTGKNGRPHAYCRATMLAIYMPQKAKKKDPLIPPDPAAPATPSGPDPKPARELEPTDEHKLFLNKVADLVLRLKALGHLIIITGDFNLAPDPYRLDRLTGAPKGPEHRIFSAFLERTQLVLSDG